MIISYPYGGFTAIKDWQKPMHTIQSFILRLMVESDHPEVLRGSLQSLTAERAQWSFHDDAELIELLKALNHKLLESNPEEE